MRIYAYLRASTKEQDAERAKSTLLNFAQTNNLEICHFFVENQSGNKLNRPELLKLIEIAAPGDAILIEQIDRLTRLKFEDWETLKAMIKRKQLKIISLDLPDTHQLANEDNTTITSYMIKSMMSFFVDILAAMAYKDYEDRRRRQAQGIEKAKKLGKYKGRPEDHSKQAKIESLLRSGNSYKFIREIIGCSDHTISKVNKRLKMELESSQ